MKVDESENVKMDIWKSPSKIEFLKYFLFEFLVFLSLKLFF